MSEKIARVEHRQYPIGALTANEASTILLQPGCQESVTLDDLVKEWRQKSAVYNSSQPLNLETTDSDIQPLNVSASTKQKVDGVVGAYRNSLPVLFDLAFVPIAKLVTPQKSVNLERAHAIQAGRSTQLSKDEVAELCLGTPIKKPKIEATFTGMAQNPQNPTQVIYTYQFSSWDQDIRPIAAPGIRPFHTVDWSTTPSQHKLELESAAFSVGPGPSPVWVAKVPIGNRVTVDPETMAPFTENVYRLILHNGVHRVFRLAELGNTHVATIVSPANAMEIPAVLVESPREALLGPRPLTIIDLLDARISKSFAWKRMMKTFRIQVSTAVVDQTFT